MLGAVIHQAREQRGVSQEKLAERVGVSRQAVSKWEQGKAVPNAENLERIEQALDLPPGTLVHQNDSGSAGSLAPAVKHTGLRWMPLAFLAVSVVLAFCAGRWIPRPTAPVLEAGGVETNIVLRTPLGAEQGAQAILPAGADGAIQLQLPLSRPGEETALAMRLALYQWPEMLPLDKEKQTDFDRVPPLGTQDRFLAGEWELVSQIPLPGCGVLGLARTVEEHDGPTLWLMGRSSPTAPWTILDRMGENDLLYVDAPRSGPLWAVPTGKVLGYDGLLVRYGEQALVLAAINGSPRAALCFWNLAGFADLDLDGELEAVCRQSDAGYEIYDREPDGYYRYTFTPDINALELPDQLGFVFDENYRAFGFTYPMSTKWSLIPEAPVYDRLSAGGLWRRDKPWDDRAQAGLIDGTAVVFQTPRPDEVIGWAQDGTPLPTARQAGAAILQELEALTGYRPQRCYLTGGNVSLEQDADFRSFCGMSLAIPAYWDSPELYDYRYSIPSIYLIWQDEWSPWSPLVREDFTLPDGWAAYTAEERALWWYDRTAYFNRGPIRSIEAAQRADTLKLNLEGGAFLEITLDEKGFLHSIYGPYEKGFEH